MGASFHTFDVFCRVISLSTSCEPLDFCNRISAGVDVGGFGVFSLVPMAEIRDF